MRKASRVLLFLLLNIVISAATSLSVLWVWEQLHPRPEASLATQSPGSSLNFQQTQTDPVPTLPVETSLVITNEDVLIQIRTIVGAGNLSLEYVEIVNRGKNPADLTSWQLTNNNNQIFEFPALILNSDGAIKIYSKIGTDTVIELFWQSDTSIWQSGETARLFNAAGDLIDEYTIP